MDISALFEQLEDIKATSSRSEKDVILSEVMASDNADLLQQIASYLYDPYRRIYVRVTDDIGEYADSQMSLQTDADVWGQFVTLLSKLETRSISGNEARRQVAIFLESIPEEYVEWFTGILNKDLKIGVGRKILEKHIPYIAPHFSPQLCPSQQWDGRLIPPGGWLVSPKIDGIRGIVGPFGPDLSVHGYTALSRKGLPLYNTEHIVQELAGFAETFHRRNSVWPVFDGEFYTHGWELSSSITSTRTPHPEVAKLQYYVFDIITHPEWNRAQCKAAAQFRDSMLSKVLTYSSDCIVHVPSILSLDPEEVRIITETYVDDGFEGAVLKGAESLYEFKRSRAWMKFKPFLDEDLIVSKVDLGWLDSQGRMYQDNDSRREGTRAVRALIVERNGVETHVGTGMTHDQRRLFCEHPELVVGKTVTVRYQRVTEDGRLIFPRLKGVRSDK
jgi:DNA ligase-1